MGLAQFVNSIDWEHEAYPVYEDFAVLPLFALFFPTVRFFLDRLVFQVRRFELSWVFSISSESLCMSNYLRKRLNFYWIIYELTLLSTFSKSRWVLHIYAMCFF